MKLERGQIKDVSEITECSIQQIHRVLNGERSKESRSGKKIVTAIKMIEESRKIERKEIKKAIKKIDQEFDKK